LETIGVDPAVNLINSSLKKGVITIPNYFDLKLARHLSKNYSLIIAMNVFAHTSNPFEILQAAREILDEDGLFIIQTSQSDMVINSQIDTFYHEHISFFNVKSMQNIVNRSGLYLSGLEIIEIHGRSYLWYLTKKPTNLIQFNQISDRLSIEEFEGIFSEERYSRLANDANKLRENVVNQIENFRKNNFKIVVYGASAKGNTFLNFCQIKIDNIYDDNDLKIGKYAPIGNVIVEHPISLSSNPHPMLFVITSWNFADEIIRKIKNLRRENKDFYIKYYPELVVQSIHD
jgi:novobiocin biosynthesis protein NovU/D-mycarose 3-C-methyltransferase